MIRPIWKVCIENPFLNCEFVYPIQQRKVSLLIDSLKKNDNVEKIVIFGSSVTSMCHIGSDIDIYVKLIKNEECLIKDCFDFVYDLWTNYTIDDRLKHEIEAKGILVYDRIITG